VTVAVACVTECLCCVSRACTARTSRHGALAAVLAVHVKLFADGTPTLSTAGHCLWTFTVLGVGAEAPKVYFDGAQAVDGVHPCVIYRGGACACVCCVVS